MYSQDTTIPNRLDYYLIASEFYSPQHHGNIEFGSARIDYGRKQNIG